MTPDYTLRHITTNRNPADGTESFDVDAVCPPCGASENIGKSVSDGQAHKTAGKMVKEWTDSMHKGHGTPGDKSTQPHITISPTGGGSPKKIYTPADAAPVAGAPVDRVA